MCLIHVLQSGEGDGGEETDGVGEGDSGATGKKRWWQPSGDKKPQKFGWIMGVLVGHYTTAHIARFLSSNLFGRRPLVEQIAFSHEILFLSVTTKESRYIYLRKRANVCNYTLKYSRVGHSTGIAPYTH